MTDLTQGGGDAGIAGVVAALKIRPKRIRITATGDDGSGSCRQWYELQYDFEQKLAKLGQFLVEVAKDVFDAGGYVTSIKTGTELRPSNDRADDYTPTGKWRCMHIDVSIKTQKEVHANNAAWDEAVRSIFSKGNKS
jgi:hypothetical protein